MIIDRINNIENKYYSQHPSFRAYLPEKFYKFAERQTINIEFGFRKTSNFLLDFLLKLNIGVKKLNSILKRRKYDDTNYNIKEFAKTISELDDTSPYLVKFSYDLSKLLSQGKEIEINIENGELQNIVNSDECSIFIMNHDKQKEDSKMLGFFNALLTREYIVNNKADNCPRTKVILNRDILDSSSNERKILGEKWGAVGVDAAIHCTNHIYNGRITAKLIKELIDNKINLFIFPEGRMCTFKTLAPEWKFQSGIADIIKSVAKKKSRVKVIPLGFAYKGKTGSIHIGEPVYFKSDGDRILFTPKNLDERYSSKDLIDFINNTQGKNDEYIPILENGRDVPLRKSGEYIAGILCDNLYTCKKQAADSIKNAETKLDNSDLYVIEDK